MSQKLYIGGLARLCGRSVHTIRWYEAQGLLPNVARDAGGRRVYVQGHVEHLVFLEWLRQTGMSVEDMRAFTALGLQGWRTIPQREERLRKHRKTVQEEIAMLQGALQLIDAKLAYFAEWRARKKRPPHDAQSAWAGAQHVQARASGRSHSKPPNGRAASTTPALALRPPREPQSRSRAKDSSFDGPALPPARRTSRSALK